MRQHPSTLIACGCAALLAGSALTGCSAIGLGLGSAIDAGTPDVTVQDSVGAISEYIGKRLILTTRDRQSIAGLCIDWVQTEDTMYLRRYDQAVAAGLTPALNAPVTVVTAKATSLDGILTGYRLAPPSARHRDLRARSVPSWQICMRAEGAAVDTALMLKSVNAIVAADNRVHAGDLLQGHLTAGRIPTGEGLLLVNWRRTVPDSLTGEYSIVSAPDSLVIPLTEIDKVEIANNRNTKWTLGKLGLLFDAVIAVIIAVEGDGLGGQ